MDPERFFGRLGTSIYRKQVSIFPYFSFYLALQNRLLVCIFGFNFDLTKVIKADTCLQDL